MRVVERAGEFVLAPDTSDELATIREIAASGSHARVSTSGAQITNHSPAADLARSEAPACG